METYTRPPRTGLEAFELMPEGTLCQLINDVLIMSPAPTPNHQETSRKIFSALNDFIYSNDLGQIFYSPIDVYLNSTNVFQPDIVFVSKKRKEIIDWNRGIMGAPDLVIEVLSKGNRQYDLNAKLEVYEREGVKEYWTVDYKTKVCKGYILINNKFQTLEETTGNFTVHMFNLSIQI